ncbi:MAG: hypothetical protein WB562_20115 [Candidatus Sulfotelmatobacter sp.]
MSVVVKVELIALCAVALVFVALKLILPLVWMYIGGVGVEFPLPKRLVTAYPKLATYLFVLGGPLLFGTLVPTGIWLLRLRISPR